MKLVELAKKWKNDEITDDEFNQIAKTIIVWTPEDLENELDDKIQISINGNSWVEVDEEVFFEEYDLYDEFYRKFNDARK